MKKFLLTVVSITIFSSVSFSQNVIEIYNKNIQSVVDDTITFWHGIDLDQPYNDFEHKDFVKVVNNSTRALDIMVRRIERKTVDSTMDYFCWNSCFDAKYADSLPIWNVSDIVTVAPNDTAGGVQGYTVYFVPYWRDANTGQKVGKNRTGEAVYEYQFYSGESSSSLFIKWSFSEITKLNENDLNEFKFNIFPNPAINKTTFKFDSPIISNDAQLVVFDLMGKKIERVSLRLRQTDYNLDLSGYSKGIYFVSVVQNGVSSKTSKLVVH